jgi:hypothetical protein
MDVYNGEWLRRKAKKDMKISRVILKPKPGAKISKIKVR